MFWHETPEQISISRYNCGYNLWTIIDQFIPKNFGKGRFSKIEELPMLVNKSLYKGSFYTFPKWANEKKCLKGENNGLLRY